MVDRAESFGSRQFMSYADCFGSLPSIECYDIEKGNESLSLKNAKVELANNSMVSEVKSTVVDVKNWLPAASEAYGISPNFKDYVMVPVVIMPSDLPNRNCVAFTFMELTKFSVEAGCLTFQTWKGKPTYVEHDNLDPSKASGVNFAVAMRPLENARGEIYKIIVLSAFDRSKNPRLVNGIINKETISYSMGAAVRDYRCSICGTLTTKGGCNHVIHGKPSYNVFDKHLAYLQVVDPIGFEVSSVKVPAYWSASNPHFISAA